MKKEKAAALKLMNRKCRDREKVLAADKALRDALSDVDRFWVRWMFFAVAVLGEDYEREMMRDYK